MGNTSTNLCRRPMKIHNLYGKFLLVSEDKVYAVRMEGYSDGMFFGSRTVDRDEQIEITITQMVQNWNGSIRFGFTCNDPVDLNKHPEGIPRYMCPDLIKRGGAYTETLNHIKFKVGDRIVFWVSQSGEVYVKVNDMRQCTQITKLVTQNVWPAVDVYGNTVGVKFRSLKDKVSTEEVCEPHIYTLLNLSKFPVNGNPVAIEIVNQVIVRRKAVNKAFIWNVIPLPVNTVWALYVKEVDFLVTKDLAITVLTVAPDEFSRDFPESLEGFTNGSIFKNVYSHMNQSDEVAICVTDTGAVMTALNGRPFNTIGSVPKTTRYWVVTDLDCDILSLQSLGVYQITKYLLPRLPSITENFATHHPSLSPLMSFEDNSLSSSQTGAAFSSFTGPISPTRTEPPSVQLDVVPIAFVPPNNDSECVICLASVPNSVFIPCGHICCCKLCADNLMNEHGNLTCPTCRMRIESNIEVKF